MNGLNGIIIDGKVYYAIDDSTFSWIKCDLIGEDGKCLCRDFCFVQGRTNIFRFSQSLTDKLNSDGNQQEDTSAGL